MRRKTGTAETAKHAEKTYFSAIFARSAVKRRSVWVLACVLCLAPNSFAATTAIRAGKVVDAGGKVITNAVILIDGDRITSIGTARATGRRRGDRPEPLHADPRPDRSPHPHDVLLGPGIGHAAAQPATPACGRDNGARRGERAADARDRRHHRARPGGLGRCRLRHARPDQHGQDGRPAHVRRRPGTFGSSRRRAKARLSPAGGSARRRRVRLGQGLRIARQLPERRYHADADVRGDEGRGRRRAREGPSGRDSLLRRRQG